MYVSSTFVATNIDINKFCVVNFCSKNPIQSKTPEKESSPVPEGEIEMEGRFNCNIVWCNSIVVVHSIFLPGLFDRFHCLTVKIIGYVGGSIPRQNTIKGDVVWEIIYVLWLIVNFKL